MSRISFSFLQQLCGRSKHNFDHVGNRRLRLMVANNLKAYVEAPTRRDKSDLISNVADEIRSNCHGGGFVRKEKDGQWVEVGPTVSREKVSHAFRDSLLKQSRRRGSHQTQQLEGNRQHTWKEAQDEIFCGLNMNSETNSTTSDSDEIRPPGLPVFAQSVGSRSAPSQLYAKLQQAQQDSLQQSNLRLAHQQEYHNDRLYRQIGDTDQINEDLVHDNFPWI